jgi:hypothetical protein
MMNDCRIEEAGQTGRVRQRVVEPRSFVLAAGCAPDNHRVHSCNSRDRSQSQVEFFKLEPMFAWIT